MPSFEQRDKPLSDEEWYDTARAKANSFIHRIDPSLQVAVEKIEVPETEDEAAHSALVLSFTSVSDPNLRWKIKVPRESDFIENNLEAAVRGVYKKEKAASR